MITLSRDTPRLWSVLDGVLLVATDLHGDNDTYHRIRDRFVEMQAHGQVDGLVFTGDLIHRNPGNEDASLDILLDIMRLKADYGDGVLILLGNHEMPHIYGATLARGREEMTPPFEIDLQESGLRDMVRKFLAGLPFYLRTSAGVCLAHAGAAPSTSDPDKAGLLFRWDHGLLLAQAEDYLLRADAEGNGRDTLRSSLSNLWGAAGYDELALHYMGIAEADDPHYDDLLRGFIVSRGPAYDLLWEALFTRCERQYPKEYPQILANTLDCFSTGFIRQNALVSGHMVVMGGYQVVEGRQLRVASGTHAGRSSERKLLLFDASKTVKDASQLVYQLQSV